MYGQSEKSQIEPKFSCTEFNIEKMVEEAFYGLLYQCEVVLPFEWISDSISTSSRTCK